MPDLSVEESGELERILPPADKPPVHPAVPPHDFVESEFPAGKGHCDVCGGGPDAEIHNHVDPLVRIADALEGIREVADAMLEMMRAEAAK